MAFVIDVPNTGRDKDTGKGKVEDIFKGVDSVLVTQHFEAQELCGIEAKNRYTVSTNESGRAGATLFFAQERSAAMQRICCSPCRSLTMNIHRGGSTGGNIELFMEKPFHWCELKCLARPNLYVC